MKGIREWANRNSYNDSIYYVFANGDGEGSNLERLFVDMWSQPGARKNFRLSKRYSHALYGFDWMKGEPALQAADIAAYELHKGVLQWIENGYSNMHLDEMRKSLGSLARADHYGSLYRKEELRLIFDALVIDNQHRQLIADFKRNEKSKNKE